MDTKQRKPSQPKRCPTGKSPSPSAQPSDGIRLNKAIAASGLCSRRKADEYIQTGKVSVNGIIETNPARHVLPDKQISVAGKCISRAQGFCYYLLHKPVQTVCTVSDPQGRPTVLDCLPESARTVRLYPVGRLDYFSEGLLLLTNDGGLAQRLMHPRHHQPKTYEVLVREPPRAEDLAAMRDGMILAEGEKLLPVEVHTQRMPHGQTLLRMVLHQGVNRQIRRMCRDVGLTILRLKRISQGPLSLGELPCGQARELTPKELATLKASVGL